MAVIKIKDSFDGHLGIRRVVLANEGCETSPGMNIRLAGWGYNEYQELPEDLHEIQQSIMDNRECYQMWGGDITSRYKVNAPNSMFDVFMKILIFFWFCYSFFLLHCCHRRLHARLCVNKDALCNC